MARRAHVYVEPRLPGWWDRTVIVLTVLSIAILLVDARLEGDVEAARLIIYADLAVCAVFLFDFGWRLAKAEQRWAFFRRNWIDLLGSIPLIEPLRAARIVRFTRLLRVLRIVVLVRRVFERHDIHMPPAVRYLMLLATGIWLLAGAGFYAFEGGANDGVTSIDDALWWSMTTLTTVGYGDLYPATGGGRVVALVTMVLGIGVLGTLAGTLATAFMDARDRRLRGKRSYVMKDHLLMLGWNEQSAAAIAEFRADPRFVDAGIVLLADLERTPVEDSSIKFVAGSPALRANLERASADKAGAVLVMSADPRDARSDLETAVVVHALRRLNPTVPVAAELVDAKHRSIVSEAGANAAVSTSLVVSALLVRSVQDLGAFDLVMELLSNEAGSEFYRVPIPSEFTGKDFRDYAHAMIERAISVVALARDGGMTVNPEPGTKLAAGDQAFVVARDPPT